MNKKLLCYCNLTTTLWLRGNVMNYLIIQLFVHDNLQVS